MCTSYITRTFIQYACTNGANACAHQSLLSINFFCAMSGQSVCVCFCALLLMMMRLLYLFGVLLLLPRIRWQLWSELTCHPRSMCTCLSGMSVFRLSTLWSDAAVALATYRTALRSRLSSSRGFTEWDEPSTICMTWACE